LFARKSRQVTYLDFRNARAVASQFRQKLSSDHRPLRLQLKVCEHFPAEELKAAIHVTYPQPEEQPHQDRPSLAIQAPHKRVGAADAASYHDVMIRQLGCQPGKVRWIKLPISVTQQHVLLAGGVYT